MPPGKRRQANWQDLYQHLRHQHRFLSSAPFHRSAQFRNTADGLKAMYNGNVTFVPSTPTLPEEVWSWKTCSVFFRHPVLGQQRPWQMNWVAFYFWEGSPSCFQDCHSLLYPGIVILPAAAIIKHLTTMIGVTEASALYILGEIGADMSVWRDSAWQ